MSEKEGRLQVTVPPNTKPIPRNDRAVNAGLILGRGGLVPLHPIVIRPVTVALCAARARGNVARRWLNA